MDLSVSSSTHLVLTLAASLGHQPWYAFGGPRPRGSIPGGLYHATRSGKARWKRALRVRG